MKRPLVLKLGGELVETPAQRGRIAACTARQLAGRPVIVVHGGGRAVDVELERRGIAARKVDGLRITDADSLGVVVAVLAGSSNTELVAALVSAKVPAVGLTGVDAGFGRAVRAVAHRTAGGQDVDLGFVGDPTNMDTSLLRLLAREGYVPVIASLGMAEDGTILNVNADVMACRLAESLGDCDLVIAGGTAGVLDASGASIAALDLEGIDRVIADRTATAGMVAKLSACRTALASGVASVRIIDGRGLDAAHGVADAAGTTLVAAAGSVRA
jgi:acetylglutamate kinase